MTVVSSCALVGCGEDDDKGGGTGGTGTGGTGTGGTGTGGTSSGGTSSGGTSSGGTAGSAGSAGSAGNAGSAGASASQQFCDGFDATCVYGAESNYYASETDCKTKFEGYDSARRTCVIEHLANAVAGNKALHCPHAAGEAPCN
ncbi:MAG: hypothetical protein KF718_12640 [Polyangiaceae bacterium]|nr:hypothetical protein [Polyangiaceae bacterium]